MHIGTNSNNRQAAKRHMITLLQVAMQFLIEYMYCGPNNNLQKAQEF